MAALPLAALLLGSASAHAQDMLPREQKPAEPVRQAKPADADTLEDSSIDRGEFDGEELPEPIHRVAPDPELATRPGRAAGTVVVVLKVRRDGTAEEPRVLRSVPGLDRAALDAVRIWTWKPGTKHGKPVDMEVGVPVRFVSWPNAATDWTAERRLALTLEQDQRAKEAFERYAFALRALPENAPRDTLDMLRRDILRVRSKLPRETGTAPRPDLAPVEALIHEARGDSAARNARSVDDWRTAIGAYQQALRWAPWQSPIYSRLAEAEWRTGERVAATAHLELYLMGDLTPTERTKASERLARLRATTDTGNR